VTGGSGLARLRVGQWFAVTLAVLAAALLAGTVIGTVALSRNKDARVLVADRVDPALVLDERLERALVDQQSGIRGYLLSGREAFLEPYDDGLAEEERIAARLRALTGDEALGALRRDLAGVQRAAAGWRADYAEPVRAALAAGGQAPRPSEEVGKRRFDAVRGALRRLDARLVAVRGIARDDLEDAAGRVRVVLLAVVAVLLLLGLAAALALRRAVTQPLAVLAADVRDVARGQFGRPLAAGGARDVAELGADVESMRRRIVQELAALEEARARLETQARDLQRSNAELEQFAYVASHDLQEPLRKVASFCQLLERRYAGQLDERADQYIAFAVDGAKRMQGLINDLLAFSRVGRAGTHDEEVALEEVVAEAQAALATALEESEAEVEVGPLPRVRGDRGLLALAFQNLIGNAVKFRSPDRPPRVTVRAERAGACWDIAVSDNGIGIDEAYADKIFVIFQRLHAKESYAGTGIGLAMVRKVAEHHGGSVRLVHGADGDGSTFVLRLPVLDQEPAPADEHP
jgi:signal transduction histidine kinase